MQTQFIAHVRKKDREPQYLWEHLEEVSELAEQFAGKVGLKDENGDSKLTRH
jgi:HD superfamily phosphodiesterase